MITLILHSLQPSRGAVNFILAQLYIGVNTAEVTEHLARIEAKKRGVLRLPDAVPDGDPDRPVRVLPIRIMREEPHT